MPKRNTLNYLIAASLTAPVAAYADTSDVTVYGVANVSYDLIDTGATAASQGAKSNRVSSNASRLGLKGSEDLGDGLSAVWQVESLVNIGNGGAAGTGIGGRNTYAGLSSAAAGTLLLGRYDTPYNISTRKLDLFGDGIADNRAIMGGNAAEHKTRRVLTRRSHPSMDARIRLSPTSARNSPACLPARSPM